VHQIIFLASASSIETMEADENPANAYPCMSTQGIHRDARAQLYAQVTGEFLDVAGQMELLDRIFSDEGPYIYLLDSRLKGSLARLDEDHVEDLVQSWMQCQEIEELDLDTTDLQDFMFQLIHFCQTGCNDDLGVYIYSDD
jgi:hypothetical protein